MSDLEDLIARLRSVSDDLADRAISVLSEASRAGRTERPDEERALTQARRAVEKAIAVLEKQQGRSADDD